jgi:hypothetical protein
MENTLVVFEYNRPASCLHYMSYECLQGAFFHLCTTERLARPRNDYVSPPGAASSCTYMRGNTPFRSVLPNMCPFHHCFSCITMAQLTQHDFRLRNQKGPHIAITPTVGVCTFLPFVTTTSSPACMLRSPAASAVNSCSTRALMTSAYAKEQA